VAFEFGPFLLNPAKRSLLRGARIQRLPTNNKAAYEAYLRQRPLVMAVPAQNAEGLRLLDEAIALDPKFALAHAMRARRFTFSGNVTGRDDYTWAIQAAQTAISLDPQLSRAHYALGVALSKVGHIDDARLAMQRAIELDSNNYMAMEDLAIMEVNAGRLDQAVYWARRALPLAPNIAGTHYTLALPVIFLDATAAERYLTTASRRFPAPGSPLADYLHSMLAVIDMRRGNAAAGLARMRALEPSYPGNAQVTALTNELATYAEAPDAAERLDAAVRTSPAQRGVWAPYTMRTLRAHLFIRARQSERARPLIDAALADIRNAVQDGDRGPNAPYEEAALQLMLGNRDRALDLFDKTIDAGALEGEFPKVDPLMAGIRHEPRFVASLARIESRLAEMRQRVDLSGLEELVPAPR